MIGQAALNKPPVRLALGLYGASAPPPVVYDPDYQAILTYATSQGFTQPSLANKAEQNAFLLVLKSSGVWVDLDVFYNFFTDGSLSFACINWKAPGTFQATPIGAPALIVMSGIQFSGVNYLDTGWKPVANGVKYQLNEAGFGSYIASDVASNLNYDMGCSDNINGVSDAIFMNSRTASNFLQGRVNSSSTIGSPAAPSSVGFIHAQRTAAGANKMFKDGLEVSAGANASTTRPTVNLFIGASNGNGAPVNRTTRRIGMSWAGASETGKELAFATAWAGYMAAGAYRLVTEYGTAQGFMLPSTVVQTKGRQLIQDMILAGVWDQLDLFYNHATDGGRGFAKINWRSPGAFTGVENGTVNFSSGEGFAGDGLTGYIDTGWKPGVNGVRYTQNDASFGLGILSDLALDAIYDVGCSPNVNGIANGIIFNARNSSSKSLIRINSNISISPNALTAISFNHVHRVDSVNESSFKNGVLAITGAAVSVVPPSVNIFICATNGNGVATAFSSRKVNMVWFGASLQSKEAAFYNAWNNYYSLMAATVIYQKIIDYGATQGYALPSAATQTKGRQLIQDLIAGGVWDQMDVFYNFATDGDRNFAKINWKNPGTFQCTEVNGPLTFTSKVGFNGDGATQYLETGWSPSINGVKYTLNNAAHGCYSWTNLQSTNNLYGTENVSNNGRIYLIPRNNANSGGVGVNGPGASKGSMSNSSGLFHQDRTLSTEFNVYRNGIIVGAAVTVNNTFALAVQTLPLLAFKTSGGAINGWDTRQMGMFFVGGSLPPVAMNTAYTAYLTGL